MYKRPWYNDKIIKMGFCGGYLQMVGTFDYYNKNLPRDMDNRYAWCVAYTLDDYIGEHPNSKKIFLNNFLNKCCVL
jgi:endo-alpha-1,4-polygalactosaminidase (GH114 family)